MSDQDRIYFVQRAAEEAELALLAADPSAKAAHLLLQRNYAERASVGERAPRPADPAPRPADPANRPADPVIA